MSPVDQLRLQQLISLETYRKTGVGVKTPVWLVQEGDTLYVRTGAKAGKVKRVRNNGRAAFAPCKADGTPLGEWHQATAREVTTDEISSKTGRLLYKKYGPIKKVLAVISKMRGSQSTVLEIRPEREVAA